MACANSVTYATTGSSRSPRSHSIIGCAVIRTARDAAPEPNPSRRGGRVAVRWTTRSISRGPIRPSSCSSSMAMIGHSSGDKDGGNRGGSPPSRGSSSRGRQRSKRFAARWPRKSVLPWDSMGRTCATSPASRGPFPIRSCSATSRPRHRPRSPSMARRSSKRTGSVGRNWKVPAPKEPCDFHQPCRSHEP